MTQLPIRCQEHKGVTARTSVPHAICINRNRYRWNSDAAWYSTIGGSIIVDGPIRRPLGRSHAFIPMETRSPASSVTMLAYEIEVRHLLRSSVMEISGISELHRRRLPE
ncbi:hypothetical protein QE152_g8620 [Popillia japonica]|uniref:Uncharacterized protein n=1 Tax=Popillia japonica TaxID=7064 RepID=A0AAW1LXT6_POPJA